MFGSLLGLFALSVIAARLLVRRNSGALEPFWAWAESIPCLIWQEENGRVIWSNAAHKKLQETLKCDDLILDKFTIKSTVRLSTQPIRVELTDYESPHPMVYDISEHSFMGTNFIFAQSASEQAKSEQDRVRFIQNLSETFSHLPMGVAVFDRHRDLSLFNPALASLFKLSPAWLAEQPSLRGFLDQLRQKGALPEPKDFKSWRQQITDLEKNAASGVYHEDWNLPDERVYRVTGKPQPKEAVALYVEDISGAVGVEREYRAEVKRLYNGFDALTQGIAIFHPSGDLSFVNNKFDQIWGLNLAGSILVPNISSVTEQLQNKCEPSPVWGDLRDFATSVSERADWNADFLMLDGQQISARFVPLPDGQTFCEFSLVMPVFPNQTGHKKPTQRLVPK